MPDGRESFAADSAYTFTRRCANLRQPGRFTPSVNRGRYLDILFCTSKLEKECCDSKARRKRHGEERARRLGRRLDDLRAAATLAVMRTLPGRCHALSADLKGEFAVDLDGPYRLIFEPAHEPLPVDGSGSLDWSRVTAIRILRIGDYHNG